LINKKLEKPTNVDFENNASGEAPDGWVSWTKFQRLGANMIISNKNPYNGTKSAMLHRTEGLKYGEIALTPRQYIDATPFRGRKIRFRAAARAELVESDFAFIRLSIDPEPSDDEHEGLPPLSDSLDNYRVESSEWSMYEIEAKVPDNADIISYGIYPGDFGTAWLDAINVEIVE